jgi:hypothetical protein
MKRPDTTLHLLQSGQPTQKARPRVAIPLEQITVASPCHVPWDDMTGDDQMRYCGRCEKNVYNLSGMARAEAEALVARTGGRLCVRYYQRADGTMLTQDCPVGLARLRRPFYLIGGLAAAFLFAVMSLVIAGAFILPRLREDGRGMPGPIQQVMDWIFPPPVCVQGEPIPELVLPPPPVPPDDKERP